MSVYVNLCCIRKAKNEADYEALESSVSTAPASFAETNSGKARATLDALEAQIKSESARVDAEALGAQVTVANSNLDFTGVAI